MRRGSVPLLTLNVVLITLAVLMLARMWVGDGDGCEKPERRERTCEEEPGECPEIRVGLALPEAIRFGAAAPTVSIALFIDLGSVRSRQIFQRVTYALGAGTIGRATELRILHAPGACDIRDAERCIAARTVECAERLAPGIGIQAIGVAFDQQWQPERDLLTGVAALGVEATALRSCVAMEREVDARLVAHAEAARRHGFVEAPAGFVVVLGTPLRISPFGAWLTEASLRSLTECLVDGRCQEEP
jgi:hypothetical protein